MDGLNVEVGKEARKKVKLMDVDKVTQLLDRLCVLPEECAGERAYERKSESDPMTETRESLLARIDQYTHILESLINQAREVRL